VRHNAEMDLYENIAPSYWFLSPEDKNIAILVKLLGAAG